MSADTQSGYRMPPGPIADLADAPPSPSIRLDPLRKWLAIQEQPNLPPIKDLARPELRIAGLRIDPRANTHSRLSYFTKVILKSIDKGFERPVEGFPEGVGLGTVQWSPDGNHIALTVTNEAGRALWVADVESGRARRLGDLALNGVFGAGFGWMPDSRRLVVLAIPQGRPAAPERSSVPDGPVIQKNAGAVAPASRSW